MKELSPRDLERLEPPDDGEDLWNETASALGLIGAVIVIVLLISLFGRL